MSETKKRLILLDSHAIIHRAYHALPDFASSSGEPTGALYGLCLMIFKIIEDFKPDYIIACFDLPKPTYRHVAYEAYKAHRKKAEDDLVLQLKKAPEVFDAFSIPKYSLEGFEADDILGTIVHLLEDNDELEIIIASGDMDTMQLIKGDKVRVFTLKKGIKDTIIYNEQDVVNRFGFTPKQLIDYKGLRGDPSDNIIGIKGIGEKTAGSIIKEFGTIEKMYEVLESGNLERFKKAGLTDRIIDLLRHNKEEAVFSKMLSTIRRDAPIDFSLPKKIWRETVDISKIKNMMSVFDFRSLIQKTDSVFNNSNSNKDVSVEEKVEYELTEDLKIALWLLNSSITNPQIEDLYRCARVEDFKKAEKIIFEQIEKNNLSFVFKNIEKPLVPIIEKMKERGVLVDVDYLEKLSKDYHEKLNFLEEGIWKEAGEEFNINSPKQLGEILFNKLGLKPKNAKKTPGGALSTKESELEKLKEIHPIISKILEYREFQKLLSTYIDAIPKLVAPDNRLHAKFNQTGTTTGRMSSEDPNLQNIPIKTELGRAIRHAFVAPKGFTLGAFDYSQIELRIAAILSDDEALIDIFKKGDDVHTAVASKVFNVSLGEVTKEMRRKAKVINFGILYGMGINALRQNLKTTKEEAEKFYNDYFKTFNKLADYLNKVKEETSRTGFSETLYGRRRYFEGIKSKIPYIRASAERMAINAPIQGTQADIVKMSMISIDELIKEKGYGDKVFLILQIHDELIYELSDDIAKDFSKEIKDRMEKIMDTKDTKGVPIVANIALGKHWGIME